jgi:hypothetical protein
MLAWILLFFVGNGQFNTHPERTGRNMLGAPAAQTGTLHVMDGGSIPPKP